jgi:hypothetical protein
MKQKTSSEGWSETLYGQYVADLTEVSQAALVLAPKRAAALSKDSAMLYVRISDLENPRKVIITDYESGGAPPVGDWDGAYAYNCFLLRVASAARSVRPLFFRDIPAVYADETTPPDPMHPFATAFEAWVTEIVTGPFSWAIQLTDKNLNLSQFITSLGPAANGKILLTPQSIQYSLGADIIVSKVKTFPQFNKRWRVAAQGPGLAMELANSTWPPGEVAITGEGSVALVKYKYETITNIARERISHRKAGRPFGLAVGRARPRK